MNSEQLVPPGNGKGVTQLPPALVGVSHGTASKAGQQVVRQLIDGIEAAVSQDRSTKPEVRLGHVDVQQPNTDAALASLPQHLTSVVVPLFLSTGFHVKTDLARSAETSGGNAQVAEALGPDDRLVELLVERIAEAGVNPKEDEIILGVAGSSDPTAVADCTEMARRLRQALGSPVTLAFLAHAQPAVKDAVTAARQQHPHRRTVVASYLLAPGYFQRLMSSAGADITTEPLLAPHRTAAPQQLIDLVLARYQTAAAHLVNQPSLALAV